MKSLFFSLLLVFAGAWAVRAAELSPELAELKKSLEGKVSVGGLNIDDFRNDEDEKIESIKFYTYRDRYDEQVYRVRVTIEMTDRDDNIYFAQIQRGQSTYPEEYVGDDGWEFQIAHGSLNRPKVSAYVIQYGILKDSVYIPIAEFTDKAETPEEIIERATAGRLDIECTWHIYKYEDGEDILDSADNHETLR